MNNKHNCEHTYKHFYMLLYQCSYILWLHAHILTFTLGGGRDCNLDLTISQQLSQDHFIYLFIYVWFKYDLGQKYYAPQV